MIIRQAALCAFCFTGAATALLTCGLLRAGDQAVQATGRSPLVPVPRGHPRVYMTAERLPELRERISRPPHHVLWQQIRNDEDYLYRALVSVVEENEAAGREAIRGALTALYAPRVFEDTRHFDSAYHKCACVYDWCYSLLTDEERERFIQQFTTLPNQPNKHDRIYIGYPARMSSIAAIGHQSEGYLLTSQLPAGIAIYDENQTLYDAAARLFFEKFVPVRNFHYASHAHHQGIFYGVGRFHFDVQAALLFDALGATHVYNSDQRFVPYYFLYARQPDGISFPVGDAIAGGNPDEVYAKIGSYYHDPYLLGLADEQTGGDLGKLFDLLWRDEQTQPRPISELPKTKYFPSPAGAMAARTGWNIGPDSRDAAVLMHIGEYYFGNHQHYDSGTFQIAYRGNLAISSGYYDDYGGRHGANYYNSTISKNGLLILDPDGETRFGGRAAANDGGQSPLRENKHDQFDVTRMAQVTAHAFGPDELTPDFSYISGDLTAGYDNERASAVTRSMVMFNLKTSKFPCSLVVFDRVHSTDPAFRKTWLVHSVQEPEISGSTIHIARTGRNRGTRNTRMPDDAEFGGRLVAESLLPKSASIKKVGGPGREFWVPDAQANFVPDIKPRKGRAFDPGAWRVEVSPTNAARYHRFLHVLSVMDVETEPGPVVELIEAENMAGACIHDRAVLFARETARQKSVEFVLPSRSAADSGETGVLVCDLRAGLYTLRREGQVVASDLPATEEGGCISVSVAPGTCRLERMNELPSGSDEQDFWDRLRAEQR